MRVIDYRNKQWDAIANIKLKNNETTSTTTMSYTRVAVEYIGYHFNKAQRLGNWLGTPVRKICDYVGSMEPGKIKVLKVAAIIMAVFISSPLLIPIHMLGDLLRCVGARTNEKRQKISEAEDKIFEVQFCRKIYDKYNSEIKNQSVGGFLGMNIEIERQLHTHLTNKFPDIADEDAKKEWITEFRGEWSEAVNELNINKNADLTKLNTHVGVDVRGALLIQVLDAQFRNEEFKERIDAVFANKKILEERKVELEGKINEYNEIMKEMLTITISHNE